MIQTTTINLARRPFRNNTVHYAVLLACLLLLTAATAYNVVDFVRRGRELTLREADLRERTTSYRELARDVERMKLEIGRVDLATLNTRSRFAHGLIVSRLFSWSTLFDRLEELIPPDVRIRSIRPSIGPDRIEIRVDGLAQTEKELYEFESRLDQSDWFASVYPVSENTRESKTEINFDLVMDYLPSGKVSARPALSATAGDPAQPGGAAGAEPATGAAASPEPSAGGGSGTTTPGQPPPEAGDGSLAAPAQGSTAPAAAMTPSPQVPATGGAAPGTDSAIAPPRSPADPAPGAASDPNRPLGKWGKGKRKRPMPYPPPEGTPDPNIGEVTP